MNSTNSYLFSIKIDRLKVDCIIGWYDWEHEQTQPVYVTVECDYLANASVADDDLDATLDYDGPKDIIMAILKENRFKLLEAAAIRISNALIAAYPKMQNLIITLEKPNAIADADGAIVSLSS